MSEITINDINPFLFTACFFLAVWLCLTMATIIRHIWGNKPVEWNEYVVISFALLSVTAGFTLASF